jgi:hypothetical protein
MYSPARLDLMSTGEMGEEGSGCPAAAISSARYGGEEFKNDE